MRVTIIADASHCTETKAAGYGFWAVSERARHGGGGSFQHPVDTSSAAELLALVNGLFFGKMRGVLDAGDHVLLQTDCQRAIDVLSSNIKVGLTRDERAGKKRFYELTREYACTVSFRHVKGHTNKTEARYVTNNLCDKRAKEGMRLARRRLRGDMEAYK
ncbi:RNase H family protein [Sphingobium sp.]|uniref:ribonuclease HI n=1 Tax=Sphingobium sp. TaxID=1912891 RepID=UPI00257A0AD2|nr:RNase H family protein [Sphingobium sp.]